MRFSKNIDFRRDLIEHSKQRDNEKSLTAE